MEKENQNIYVLKEMSSVMGQKSKEPVHVTSSII